MNDMNTTAQVERTNRGQDEKVRYEQQLLRNISEHDGDALGILYDRYAMLVYGLILQVVRNREEAEDLLQEVFVQIWKRAESYDHRFGPPSVWVIRIARNRAIDYVRSKRFHQKKSEIDLGAYNEIPVSDGRSSPDSMTMASQVSSFVSQALEKLPTEQRRLIEMAYFEGYSHSELAKKLSIPLGTVKTRIRIGMTSLQKFFSSLPELSQPTFHI